MSTGQHTCDSFKGTEKESERCGCEESFSCVHNVSCSFGADQLSVGQPAKDIGVSEDPTTSLVTTTGGWRSFLNQEQESPSHHIMPNIDFGLGMYQDTVDVAALIDSVLESTRRSHGKRVKFWTVQIREFERVLGDNPSCSGGAPIAIGWAHSKDRTVRLDDFELARSKRRSLHEMIMSRRHRQELLLEWGESMPKIVQAIRVNNRVKNQRRRTVNSIGTYDRWEEVVESAGRKLKRTLTGGGSRCTTSATTSIAKAKSSSRTNDLPRQSQMIATKRFDETNKSQSSSITTSTAASTIKEQRNATLPVRRPTGRVFSPPEDRNATIPLRRSVVMVSSLAAAEQNAMVPVRTSCTSLPENRSSSLMVRSTEWHTRNIPVSAPERRSSSTDLVRPKDRTITKRVGERTIERGSSALATPRYCASVTSRRGSCTLTSHEKLELTRKTSTNGSKQCRVAREPSPPPHCDDKQSQASGTRFVHIALDIATAVAALNSEDRLGKVEKTCLQERDAIFDSDCSDGSISSSSGITSAPAPELLTPTVALLQESDSDEDTFVGVSYSPSSERKCIGNPVVGADSGSASTSIDSSDYDSSSSVSDNENNLAASHRLVRVDVTYRNTEVQAAGPALSPPRLPSRRGWIPGDSPY